MRTDRRFHLLWFLFLAALCCASCKKRVAAAPPQPPAQPAPQPRAEAPAPRPAAPAPAQPRPAAAVTPAAFTPRPDVRAVDLDQLFKQNMQTIYFDYDQSEIRADQVPRLEAAAKWLQQNRNVKFRVQGNSDERGSQEYNLALGDRRAVRVRDFLVREGVDASRMTTLSFGEERPVCSETTETCFQRNRRADFQTTSTN